MAQAGALVKKLGGMCSWPMLTPYPVQDQGNRNLRPCSRTKDEKDTLSSIVDRVNKQYRFFIELAREPSLGITAWA